MNRNIFSFQRLLCARAFLNDQHHVTDACIDGVDREDILPDEDAFQVDRLNDQTREAVRKFWASAKQPAVEVAITDQLIADLKERGDLFCRPPRPFFSIGGRSGGLPPFVAPGARPAPAVPPPPAPAQ